jgi:hypothetical protein
VRSGLLMTGGTPDRSGGHMILVSVHSDSTLCD